MCVFGHEKTDAPCGHGGSTHNTPALSVPWWWGPTAWRLRSAILFATEMPTSLNLSRSHSLLEIAVNGTGHRLNDV